MKQDITVPLSIVYFTSLIEKLKEKRVLLIGDTIIDHYIFVQPKGRAVKDPILSVNYSHEEKYAGGVLAVANHISSFVNEVKVLTLLGDKLRHQDFISNAVFQNIKLKTFTKIKSQF